MDEKGCFHSQSVREVPVLEYEYAVHFPRPVSTTVHKAAYVIHQGLHHLSVWI